MATYTLLKKPYTPFVYTSAVATFNVYGKSFMQLQAVYLSGHPYTDQTFYNPFSAVPKLSANYPGFFAVKLLSSQYTTNFDNTITFTLPSAVRPGYIDIIVQNPAGYGSLKQYAIKELYTGQQTQAEIRPWAPGVLVQGEPNVPEIYTIDFINLVTIDGDYIVRM